MSAGTFAFTVHPRARLAEDMGRVWKPLGAVPEGFYATALRRLPLPPVDMARVHIGGEQVGRVLLVPFGARHMLAHVDEARRRVSQAVDRAVREGADVVGLGALTATVTAGGLSLRQRTGIGVTNGNAYTAAIIDDQIRMLLDTAASGRHVAIVGASGSVGGAVTRLLAADGAADRLTLVARSAPKLRALAGSLPETASVTVASSLDAVADADLVVLLTASADALLHPEHLAPGAVVLDATQPRNTSPDLATAREDVLLVDGGIVAIPSLRLAGGDIGVPPGHAYACFSETAILAMTGHRGHFALGAPTLAQIADVRARARDLAALGFAAAAPTCFGRPVDVRTREAVAA